MFLANARTPEAGGVPQVEVESPVWARRRGPVLRDSSGLGKRPVTSLGRQYPSKPVAWFLAPFQRMHGEEAALSSSSALYPAGLRMLGLRSRLQALRRAELTEVVPQSVEKDGLDLGRV